MNYKTFSKSKQGFTIWTLTVFEHEMQSRNSVKVDIVKHMLRTHNKAETSINFAIPVGHWDWKDEIPGILLLNFIFYFE